MPQSLILCEMMPASSSCLILWSMNWQYFSRTVYGVRFGHDWWTLHGDIPTWSSWSYQYLLCSVRYFLSSSSQSFVLASSGMSALGIELAKCLGSGSSCKLVFCSIYGSSMEVSHWRLLHSDLLNFLTLFCWVQGCNRCILANTTRNIIGI